MLKTARNDSRLRFHLTHMKIFRQLNCIGSTLEAQVHCLKTVFGPQVMNIANYEHFPSVKTAQETIFTLLGISSEVIIGVDMWVQHNGCNIDSWGVDASTGTPLSFFLQLLGCERVLTVLGATQRH